ncbi:MAG: oligosaccharide flippase family protein [Saprospiraceae bacterium]|nr:oligosaccharide flippase family protein [Saprospiraceae bacterium]
MSNSYWLKSGFYTLSEKAASLLFGFGGFVLLVRVLPDKETYGAWVLFLSIVSVIEVGRIGLLQNALVKYLSVGNGEEAGRITTASFVLNGLLTAFIALVCLGLSPLAAELFETTELALLLKIYCLASVALIPFYQFNYIQQANLDFKGIFWSNVVKGGILFFFILYLFIEKREISLAALAYAQVVAALAASLVSWLFARPYARFSRKIDWAWVGVLFAYGKFVFGTNISTQLFKTVDKLLLGALPGGGKAAVAVYDAAIRISNLTDVPTASMASMLFPQSSRRMQEGDGAVKQLYEKAVGAILAFMVPCIVLVLLLADWLILLTAGRGICRGCKPVEDFDFVRPVPALCSAIRYRVGFDRKAACQPLLYLVEFRVDGWPELAVDSPNGCDGSSFGHLNCLCNYFYCDAIVFA